MQDAPNPLEGMNVGGGDGMPLFFQVLLVGLPLLAVAGFIILLVRTLRVPDDFGWRPTRLTFKKRDEFAYEFIRGPVMVRRNGGIVQYRAMTDTEWSNSKWKTLKR